MLVTVLLLTSMAHADTYWSGFRVSFRIDSGGNVYDFDGEAQVAPGTWVRVEKSGPIQIEGDRFTVSEHHFVDFNNFWSAAFTCTFQSPNSIKIEVYGASPGVVIEATVYATGTAPNSLHSLTISPSTTTKDAGVLVGAGTVQLGTVPATSAEVRLSSSDTDVARVPNTVTIPAGSSSATFDVTIVDDEISDGTQSATITAQFLGSSRSETITVYDATASPTVIDLTPAAGTTVFTSNPNIDVTFSEPVVGVDAGDMVLSGAAAVEATVGTPTDQGGNKWRFPLSGLQDGPLQISLAPDPGDIQDLWGNDLHPQPTVWSYLIGEEGDYRYTVADGKATITGYEGPGGDITIPDTLGGYPVSVISHQAFTDNTTITSVVIPDSVTTIEGGSSSSGAFRDCTALTSVTIGNSVTSIGSSAFFGCSFLTSVTIGNSVTTIGDDPFSGCHNITEVTWHCNPLRASDIFPDSYQSITTIVIGNSVIFIGNWSFSGCTALESVTIGNSVTSIGNYAFRECTALNSVTIGSSVTSIGDDAFRDCTALESVTIPDSVTTIGDAAFRGCASLESVTIPDSVTEIGWGAFRDCTALTSVTIPDSVTTIENAAFSGCTSLTSVTIPDSITTIGGSAFSGCTALTSVTIGNSVTSIGDRAFWGCTSLESVTIPDSVTTIGDSAFSGCTALNSVTIGSSVTTIGDDAFYGCTALTSVTIGNSVTTIGWHAFRNCTALESVTIPDSVTSIWGYAFYGCTALTSVTIGNSVTTIEDAVFSGCTALTSVTIPDSVTSIGDDAFRDCTALESVTIPDSVTTIGRSAFSGCTALTSVTIGNSVTTIGSSTFRDCIALESVTIPSSVTTIGWFAFQGCTALTSVTIPDSVTTIGRSAFSGCTSLTSVTIPDSVTSIGWFAFQGCTALTNIDVAPDNSSYSSLDGVLFNKELTTLIQMPGAISGAYTIPDSVTEISSDAFRDCTALESVTIPDSVTSIGSDAFYGCTSLTSVYFCSAPPTHWGGIFDDTPATLYYLPNHADQWPETYAGRPTALWLPVVTQYGKNIATGDYTLSTFWAPDQSVTIEAATSLVNPDWEDLVTTTIPASGTREFTDPDAADHPTRFYRIVGP